MGKGEAGFGLGVLAALLAGAALAGGGYLWQTAQRRAASEMDVEVRQITDRQNAEVVARLPFWREPVSAGDVLRMARAAEEGDVWISPEGAMERTPDAVLVAADRGDGLGAVRLAVLRAIEAAEASHPDD
jgi:hypothetical protein